MTLYEYYYNNSLQDLYPSMPVNSMEFCLDRSYNSLQDCKLTVIHCPYVEFFLEKTLWNHLFPQAHGPFDLARDLPTLSFGTSSCAEDQPFVPTGPPFGWYGLARDFPTLSFGTSD